MRSAWQLHRLQFTLDFRSGRQIADLRDSQLAYQPLSSNVHSYRCWPVVLLLVMLCVVLVLSVSRGLHRQRFLNLIATDQAPEPPAYLTGWTRQRWIACTTSDEACPQLQLDTPHDGCKSNDYSNRILLTADGLSSPHVREAFQRILKATIEARDLVQDTADRSILLVLDAAYAAYEEGTQLTSSYEYCELRKAELVSLGASSVTCVIVDPIARESLWKREQGKDGPIKDFSEALLSIDDDYIYRELSRAIGVFVECGSPFILAKNFRRTLKLSKHAKKPSGVIRQTLRDIIRTKVQDGSGTFAYVGVSSGASLAGQTIFEMGATEVAQLGGDNSGLGLVSNCSFYPHATAHDEPTLLRMATAHHTGIMAVPDCQPIIAPVLTSGRLSHICP